MASKPRRHVGRLGATALVIAASADTCIYLWHQEYMEVTMTKRLIDLDDDLLAEAQRELHTNGVSDTVRAALRHAADSAARSRQVEWLVDGGLESMAEPEQRAAVWR
jgi:hypothetical protein